ncbi:MAG: hypothetical protein SGI77_28405 [Pirellulaceae bacterium]|nr:hypothetical protein [Pirellulaceae bacterium]
MYNNMLPVCRVFDAGGVPILRIEEDEMGRLIVSGEAAAATVRIAFGRVVLYQSSTGSTPPSSAVFDVLRSRTGPSSDHAFKLTAAVGTSGKLEVTAASLVGDVRCYLGATPSHSVRLTGEINVKARWKWTVRIAGTSLPFDQTTKIPITTAGESALLTAVGLKSGDRPRVQCCFVTAFLPAPRDITKEATDDQLFTDARPADESLVLQFRQRITLSSPLSPQERQRVAVGRLLLEMNREVVERARLNLPATGSVEGHIQLVQTLNAFDGDGELSPELNDWVVRIEGLPQAAVLSSYNRLAGDYFSSLETTDDGRPISGVPLFDDRIWDRMRAFDPDPDKARLAEMELRRPWVLSLDVWDSEPAGSSTDKLILELRRPLAVRFRAAIPADIDVASGMGLAYRTWFPGLARHDFRPTPQKWSPAMTGEQFLAFTADDGVDTGVLTIDSYILRPPFIFADDPRDDKGRLERRLNSIWRGFWFRIERLFQKNEADGSRRQSEPDAVSKRQYVRVGALDFGFARPLDPIPHESFDGKETKEDVSANLFGRGARDRSVVEERQRSLVVAGTRKGRGRFIQEVPSVVVQMRFRVDHAMPGGQDGLPDEPFFSTDILDHRTRHDHDSSPSAVRARFIREPALVIPLTNTSTHAPLLLQVFERTAASESRQIDINLFNWGAMAAESLKPLLIIDRQPFLVAQVWAPPLIGLGGADGNLEVGNWSADGFEGASWELAGATDGFVAHFAPQALGEGMEKRKRADILSKDNPGDNPDPVQARLSPTTHLELFSSFFRQNFMEATWNLRRILGYPGQRAPGARMRRLEFELLYGMGCAVRVDGLRLAELNSQLGAVPGKLPQRQSRPFGIDRDGHPLQLDVFSWLNFRWSRQFASFASRLGVYQPWLESQPRGLTLRDGVSYVIRPPESFMQDPAETNSNAVDQEMLPGGALWGFEFKSQYRPFVEKAKLRRSTFGELSRPALSALGGWGYQKAVFDNGLTTIYSDTAMGRTFFYSVERRGRINCAWNFAKHVVIYERTVGTAKQFRDEQDHHAGRPVLRKVREFIELLQPARSYPDFGDADVTRGCVLGIDFKSRIIPVTRRWGRDLLGPNGEAIGYVIPLWQTDADPAVYPKPQIVLKVAGAGGKDEVLACTQDEPEKMMFFSAAEAGAAAGASGSGDDFNTDRWAAVRGVDYPDYSFPSTPKPNPDPASLEAPLPDEIDIADGYEEFTYAITAPSAADLVAGRSNQTMGAMLRNVSLVRADPQSPPGDGDSQKAMRDALAVRTGLSGARAGLNALKSALAKPLTDSKARAEVQAALDELKAKLRDSNFKKQFEDTVGLAPDPHNWEQRFREGAKAWKGAADRAAAHTLGTLETRIRDMVPDAADWNEEMEGEVLKALRQTWDVYQLAVPPFNCGLNEIQDRLRQAINVPSTVMRRLDSLLDRIATEVNALLADLLNDVVPEPELQKALLAFGDRLDADVVSSLNQMVEQVRSRIARDLPPAINDLLQAFVRDVEKDLTSWVRKWRSVVSKPVDEIFEQFYELESVWSAIELNTNLKGAADKATDAFNALIGTHLKKFQELDVGATGKKLKDLIEESGLERQFETLKSAIDDAGSLSDALTRLKNKVAELEGFRNDILAANPKAFVDSIKGDFVNFLDKVKLDDLLKLAEDLTELDLADLNVDRIRGKIREALDGVKSQVELVAANIGSELAKKFPDGLVQKASNTLRLVRAFGDAPKVLGMEFNRQRLGYFFQPELAKFGAPIDMTAATALINRAGEHLKGLGISLPSGQLLDQVMPPELQNFDFGKLLPDFAGLKLDNLFPELKAPDALGDKVKVTNNFDRATGRGWAQAEVIIKQDEPTTLFDAGPIKVSLRLIDLYAKIRMEAGLSGAVKHTQFGRLLSTWDLIFGGEPLVTFHETELSFDESGRTRFTLDPSKIEMNGLLAMLSDVLKTVSDPDSGFTLRLKEENGLPVGVEAILLLPLPDLTAGAFTLANLRFGAELDLVAFPEFAIGLRVHVGEKMLPFTVAILILGGGGWFDARARYLPSSKATTTAVSIGINAGAILAVNFGPVHGCVFAFFFVEGEFRSDSRSPGSQELIIRIGIILGGDVDVMGLITVSIRLLLELEYKGESGSLIGRGTLSIRVKVCWFLTVRVNKTVEKQFAGESSRRAIAPAGASNEDRVERACRGHLQRSA